MQYVEQITDIPSPDVCLIRKAKAKVVPLHTMKVLGERGV
jgi:hypothetical protein